MNINPYQNNGKNFYKDGRTKWFKTHPEEKRLYQIWVGIRRRAGGNCYKKDMDDRHAKIYVNLSVAPEWNDWLVFYNWAINNSWKPNLTIDKIDNEKGYYPENCRWVTREENNRNRRCVKKYLYKGEWLTLPQIAKINNIPRDRLYSRIIKHGYSLEDALNKPLQAKPSDYTNEKRKVRDRNIKKDREKGCSLKDLAKKYNLHERTIWEIVNR